MPITKPSRLNILNQVAKANPQAKADLEKLLDDSSPLAQTFESMFMARSDYSRQLNELQQQQAQLSQAHTANTAWKTAQEQHLANVIAQAQQQANEARMMAKLATDKLTAAAEKAASGETLYRDDLTVDSSLRAFAATAQGTPTNPPTAPNPHLQGFDQSRGAFSEQQPQAPPIDPDQFIKKMTNSLVTEIGSLEELKYNHFQLFGEHLNPKFLIDTAGKTGRSILDIYNETYNPDTKRAEVAETQFNARVEAAVQEKLKEYAASGDPSGRANSLAALGAYQGQSPESRSVALASSGPEWTALKLDPHFAAQRGMLPPGYPQTPGYPPGPEGETSLSAPTLPPPPPAPKSFMDNFAEWEADMMRGAVEGRGNDPKYRLM